MRASRMLTGPVAVLLLPRLTQPFIAFAKAVHDALLNNPSFPSPNPPLEVFAADIAALDDAETKATSRARGAAAHRDARQLRVKEDLFHLRDYVQSVVEADKTPAEGAALIESAGMRVRKARQATTPEISAKNAGVSGKVVLVAKAAARAATYSWEYSVDQSSWTPVPDTMRCRTEVSGLTSACVYHFRFRVLTSAGRSDYSHVVSLIVH